MKIALFGGTGFIGSYILDELIKENHKPIILVRKGSESKVNHPDECKIVSGNVQDKHATIETIKNADCIIYNIGIIRQFKNQKITFEELHLQSVKRIIKEAQDQNIKRFILMSANGVRPKGTEYQTTKYLAEKYLKKTELDWTIFRPSLVFGPPRGRVEFCSQLRDDIINLPIPVPLFHSGMLPFNAGQFKMSPIHVENVSKFFIKSIQDPSTFGHCFHLGGPKDISWVNLVTIIAEASEKHKWKIPAPVFPIKILANLLEGFSWFPVSRDQLDMLLEGNICDSSDTFRKFDIEPIPFTKDSLGYLRI